MPRYKPMPMHPSQVLLFPQSVEETVAQDSDVRAFADVMDCFDYSSIESKYSHTGCPPYHPRVMVKVLCYAYSKGLRSSRRIEETLKVDVRYIWLAGGLKPDHNTIARFRKDNWQELESLFKNSVRVSVEAGLVFLRSVSTDGSKILACSSKKRVYSKSRLEREMAAVEQILQEAEDVDRAEDEQFGSASGEHVPAHLKDAKIRKARLDEIANRLKDSGKTAVVETDPDARIMVTGDGKRPCYNLQASVDAEKQIIVAMKLTQSENDCGYLPDMVGEVESNTGLSPDISLVDSGYSSEATLKWIDESGHKALMPIQEQPQKAAGNDLFCSKCFLADNERDVLICPAGRELVFKNEYKCNSGTYREYRASGCANCSFRSKCIAQTQRGGRRVRISVVEHMRKRMRDDMKSVEGRKAYALRRETVEPVFGRIKSNLGFDRFLLKGFKGASAEVALICIVHNVLKCAANSCNSVYFTSMRLVLDLQYCAICWLRPLDAQAA